ncbi:PAS domain S-box protein [Bacillus cihuensis]|uniref:PAS domain S-box protein n=1 Tax=Bacillus cihuensis TaxID=1208599 RepID=UPI0004285025|nr:PAS domain S-box protein [Bacillus cihuensis]
MKNVNPSQQDISIYQKEIDQLNRRIDDFKELFDSLSDAYIMLNSENEITYANQSACSLFGLSSEEFLFGRVLNDSQKIYLPYITTIQILKHRNLWIIQLKKGEIKHIEYQETSSNRVGLRILKLQDVTSLSILSDKPIVPMQLFLDVFKYAVDSIIIYDKNGIIMDANDSFCKMLGKRKKDIIGDNIRGIISPKHLLNWQEGIEKVNLYGSFSGEVEMFSDDEFTLFKYITSTNKQNNLYMSILRNMSEGMVMKKRAEKSEKVFAELFDHSMDAILFWKEDGTIFQANEAACKIFESTHDELIGSIIGSYVYKNHQNFKTVINKFEERGEIREELFFKMPNGQIKLLEFTGKKHHAEGYNLTIFRNVSERWLIETELRKSEWKFRKIFEGSLDGMILWTNDRIIDINHAGTKILGVVKNGSLSSFERINIPNTQKELINLLHEHIELAIQSESEISTIAIPFENGEVKHIEFATRENLYVGTNFTIIRDVTEKLAMEEQIRKSDTLHVVGELAAGIAHEIRNPMTAIKGFIQLLQNSVKEDYTTYFNVITSELQRIETIITEFLFLAKPQALKYSNQDVNVIVKETADFLEAQAMLNNIQLKRNLTKDNCDVFCEGNQLKQVLINIIKNAIEVSNDGSFVIINTERINDSFVKISIIDHGPGITEEKLRRLGEPFYTTKERGTGLGLMVSYKIIEEHKGYIEVESEAEKGATFHIFLPIPREG